MKKETKEAKEMQKHIEGLKQELMALEARYESKVRDKVHEIDERTQEKISDNPYQSVGIAFGAGALLGAALAHMMKK
jgi:ElaB/YqjD/DUF883 family membrane-anchored ribosome-binding protein